MGKITGRLGETAVGIGMWLFFFGGMIVGPIVFGFQVVLWLRDGVWTHLSVGPVLSILEIPPPNFAWLGLQKIFMWQWNASLAGSIMMWSFLLGVGLMMAVGLLIDDSDTDN